MKRLKKYTIGYNTLSSVNGVIATKGVKSKPNSIEVSGFTHEVGEGEKLPDNPYQLISLDSGAMTVDGVEYEHSIKLNNSNMSIQIPVPIALHSVKDASDYIFKDKKGVWKLMQNNKKNIYTGTETFALQSINDFGIANFAHRFNDSIYGNHYLICNFFEQQNTYIANTKTEGYHVSQTTSESGIRYKTLYFRIKLERASTLEEFKTFLAEQYENGTPLTIIYQLETPITHVLSDYAQDLLNSFTLQNQNEICVEGNPDLKISGYLQK